MPAIPQQLTISEALDVGLKHQKEGRLSQAEDIYQHILRRDPNQPVALHLKGVVAYQTGDSQTALNLINKAIELRPNYAEAYNNLGVLLRDLGELGKAVDSYQLAISLKPGFVDAHNNLGIALKDQGRLGEAVTSYRKAITLNPKNASTHSNLGNVLAQLKFPSEAFESHRRGFSLDRNNDQVGANFANFIENFLFSSIDENLHQDLSSLLELGSVQPSRIMPSVLSALSHHPNFSSILVAINEKPRDRKVPYSTFAEQLSAIPLFLQILELAPIGSTEIEGMLTILRRAMLQETIKNAGATDISPFSVALALNCFNNEYVFSETEEEKTNVTNLQQELATLADHGKDVPPSLVVSLGAYRPLFIYPWAEKLSKQEWNNGVNKLIKRQIIEPIEERRLGKLISRVTLIQNQVSRLVKKQYEQNPYPRWIKTDIPSRSFPIETVLKSYPLFFDMRDYIPRKGPKLLMAGCGTGQYAIYTASRFIHSSALAMDLSLNSLAYAQRKSQELGLSSIKFIQGDILELATLGYEFDLIVCTGVLHHMEDPMKGWKILVDCLSPGGLMNIGLYSAKARQHLAAARPLISETTDPTSFEDIRRCRQEIMKVAENGHTETKKILGFTDFFCMSECRDLLFHVQETQYTLLQIEKYLQVLNLKFLGFEIRDQEVLNKFKIMHPNTGAIKSLQNWHEFELDYPDTFSGMYQFWCQKL